MPRNTPVETAASGAARLCLVVHDDLELRLRLADLARRAGEQVVADAVGTAELESMAIERLRSYFAVLLVVQFIPRAADADPLAVVARMRGLLPEKAIFVFGRHGDERAAARAIKLGANDYWPIHSVDVAELSAALRPHLPQSPPTPAAAEPKDQRDGAAQIAGYRLMKKIGRSSTATVYLARNDDLAQPVALKVQTIGGSTSVADADRMRFAKECEILSGLNHRSIADVLDFGITPRYLYLALEYFPCGSLRDRMKNLLSVADATNYVEQIAEALQVVHRAGVVHCDLKPSNLMLTSDNRIVLIDFGSSRARLLRRPAADPDVPTGTPYYVSPEQIDGKDPDERGDLYSLGVIFYEMLTGNLPFRGASLAEILQAHRTTAIPVLPQSLLRFQPLLLRLLAKNRDERYPSAGHFLEALREPGSVTA
jgi:ActR/RegA family two-component response regulator/predicted Ser/Thr protein kinase